MQFASDLVSFGTFSSQEDFNEFVDNDIQARGGTNTASGIDQGTVLLGVSNTTAAFMIVITDGGSNTGDDPVISADVARAQGITVLAVGVGEFSLAATLNAIIASSWACRRRTVGNIVFVLRACVEFYGFSFAAALRAAVTQLLAGRCHTLGSVGYGLCTRSFDSAVSIDEFSLVVTSSASYSSLWPVAVARWEIITYMTCAR